MKRTQSLAAAVAVVSIAAGGVTSSSAAPLTDRLLDPLLDPLLDVAKVEVRLGSLGLNPKQIIEVTAFLTQSRDDQGRTLRAAGITDPGGDLSDSSVADYLLGQYMLKNGINTSRAKLLQLSSGLLEPRAAIALIRNLDAGEIVVSQAEIDQQSDAAGGLSRKDAALRARLQRTATMLRPYLTKLVPNLAAVTVDAEAGRLMISTAGAVDEVRKLVGRVAGVEPVVRPAKMSRTSLTEMVRAMQAEIAADVPGAKVTLAADPINSVVKIQAGDPASDKRVRGSRAAQARVKRGDAVVAPPRATGPTAVLGGHPTQAGNCTWGFTASNGNDKFLVTAAHCGEAAGYGIWIPTTLVESRLQGATDAARHTTDPYFYSHFDNFVERRDTAGNPLPDLEMTSRTSWAGVDYGDVVCHMGRTTGHSCGWVTSVFVAPWWVPYSGYFVQVESPTMNNQVGDSGGPWFYGNSAYGIHTGGYEGYGSSEVWGLGVYGAIDFAEQHVHFTVLTK